MVDKEKLLNGWSEICKSHYIDSSLYKEYNVLRGLRDLNGKGVLAGLTQISDVRATKIDENGEKVPCDGTLRYRGVSINELTGALKEGKRFGFEETAYLLLFGKLPNTKQLESFVSLLAEYRELPEFFISDVIIRTPCKDMMNTLQRGVLSLYNYDNNADSIAIENVLRQSLNLIAKFPLLAVYGYQSYSHHFQGKSLIIHTPKPELSTAENLLRLLRPNAEYTPLEANVLDIC